MADTLPPLTVGHRARAAREALATAGHGALLVSDRSDVRWLTGFSGSNGWAVLTGDRLVVVTDGRYREQASAEFEDAGTAADVRVGATQAAIVDETVTALAGVQPVAASATSLSHAAWADLDSRLDTTLVSDGGTIASLRRRKDEAEMARIRRAAAIAELALADVVGMLADEPTERDVRDELDYRMRRQGADGPSYDTIVGSGPVQSAHPHHRPNGRRIVDGDSVVIDVGALVDGYHSDMTRTFVAGTPTAEYAERYGAVLGSQRAGLAALAPGVASTDVDAACRSFLEERGFGDWFVHGTGHGVGLDIHEDPFLRATAATDLAEGEVVTIEPGVYRDGSGGIRIEDLVTITADGHRSFTTFPKDSPCLPSRPTT